MPEVLGEARGVVLLQVDHRFRFQIIMLGTCKFEKKLEKKKALLMNNEKPKSNALLVPAMKKKKLSIPKCKVNEIRLKLWLEHILVAEKREDFVHLRQLWQKQRSQRNAVRNEIVSGQLRMRSDRCVDADLGLRDQIVRLLFDNITTNWLRLALRVRGWHIENTALYHALTSLLFGNTHGPPSTTRTRRCQDRCLREFLALIHFIDAAASQNLASKKVFKTKSSTPALVRTLSREALAKQADIVPHLARLGILLKYEQSARDEYNFAIDALPLSFALCDGIRLARTAEILLAKNLKILAPITSRLQKIHNVQQALTVFLPFLPELNHLDLHQLRRDIVDNKTNAGIWLLNQIYCVFGPSNSNILANQIQRLHEPQAWTIFFLHQYTDATKLAHATRAAARRFQHAIIECFSSQHLIEKENSLPSKIQSMLRSVTTREWALALAKGCTENSKIQSKHDFILAVSRVYGINDYPAVENNTDSFEQFLKDEPALAEFAAQIIKSYAATIITRTARAKLSSQRALAVVVIQSVHRRYTTRTMLWQNAAAIYIQTNWRLRKRLDPPAKEIQTPNRYTPIKNIPFSSRRKRRDARRLSVCLLDIHLLRCARTFAVLLRSLAKYLHLQSTISCLDLVSAEDSLSEISEDLFENYSHSTTVEEEMDKVFPDKYTALIVLQRLVPLWRKKCIQSKIHLIKKEYGAVLTLQTFFRSVIFRQHYLNFRYVIIAVQACARCRCSISAYEKIHRGFSLLQIRSRHKIFLKNHCAIIKLQANVRGQLCRHDRRHRNLEQQNIILLQTAIRSTQAHSHYALLRSGILALQAVTRAVYARRTHCYRQSQATILNKVVRTFLARSLATRMIAIKMQAALFIQAWVKWCWSKRRQQFMNMRFTSAALTIQSLWHKYSSQKLILCGFILCQALIRRYLIVMQQNRPMMNPDDAAIAIQKRWRQHTALWIFYLRLGAQLKVQTFARRRWRKIAVQLNERRDAPLCAERPSPQSARKVRVLGMFQRRAREHLSDARFVRARAALTRIVCSSRVLTTFRKRRMFKAIIYIQAWFRGNRARRLSISAPIIAIRGRLARLKNKPAERIGNRTRAALHILRTSKSLAEMTRAIVSLETSTRLSPKCCERFAIDQAPLACLFKLMRSCNRSKPHLELLSYILRVLTNVAAYNALLPRLIVPPNAMLSLLELIQLFRDKEKVSFLLTVRLIRRIISQLPHAHRQAATADNLKRLTQIQSFLHLRKQKIQANALDALLRILSISPTTTIAPTVSVVRG
mmetsp:Transcript_12461/g.18688  ORF Transcript_12461/g.18688 Transcript_12461/m.18688 type:complete len:1270 (+) Transcript_12461:91-3900(+)